MIDIEFSTENVKQSLERLKEAIFRALPILQENFKNVKPEERTLQIRLAIQEELKSIREKQD